MARTRGDVRVLAGTDEDLQPSTMCDGFQTLHDLKARRSRNRYNPAVARMDRQRLAAGEVVQHPIEHRLVLHVPSQRSDHCRPEKEDAGGNLTHAAAGQSRTERLQAVRSVAHTGQDRVEPCLDRNACADQFSRLREPHIRLRRAGFERGGSC